MATYLELAQAALEQRARLVNEVRSVNNDPTMGLDEKRSRVETLEGEIYALTAEARANMERAEREAGSKSGFRSLGFGDKGSAPETRANDSDWAALLPGETESRAVVEGSLAAGGYAVPALVGSKMVDKLRNASIFLRGGVQQINFDGATFRMPKLATSSAPGVVAEATAITEGAMTFAGLDFNAIKLASYYTLSSEFYEDAAIDVRNEVGGVMLRDLAAQVDAQAFGTGNGTTALKGLLTAGQATAINLTTGNTTVKWSDVANAFTAIEGTGATPGVIWASPDMALALRTERENGSTGGYLAGSVSNDPTRTGWGLPLLVSGNLPTKTVILADPTRVFLGVRRVPTLAISADAGFQNDVIAYRLTHRVAGIVTAEATSVQVIKASAT